MAKERARVRDGKGKKKERERGEIKGYEKMEGDISIQ